MQLNFRWLSLYIRLIYQQLSCSLGTDANTCPSTDSTILMVVAHPSQACAATTAAGIFCMQLIKPSGSNMAAMIEEIMRLVKGEFFGSCNL